MIRQLHGAPAQVLSDAPAALARLASWVSSTADSDLRPDSRASARSMRDAAAALREAGRHLDEAADRTEAGPAGTPRRETRDGAPSVDCNAIDA